VRVLFWGTPDFATPALRALLGEGFDVVAVVTQPDRPVGRSRSTVHPSPVKQVALEEGLEVLQPERPRGDDFVAAVRALSPDVSVVVAYGHLLPREVIELPRLGTLNIHASLLPALRGAAPIQAAIRQGLSETGVSIMQMEQRLDAGPVLLRVATPVADDETAGELALRLSEMGALALIEALALLDLGEVRPELQDDAAATYAPKITRDTTRVEWGQEAIRVSRAIRACDPRPGAWTTHRGADLKLFGARVTEARVADAGTVLELTDAGMLVACGGGGAVLVAAVQPAGKRRQAPMEWARGRGIAVGERLS
jgi:methionyl-tRNA formyltransferase